jgi:hypothetical protein
LDSDLRDEDGQWGDCSPARRFSGEAVLELVVGEVPASGDGDEVADEVQQTTAILNPWSLTTGFSRGDGDARLETTAASVIVGELEMLQQRAR